MSYRLYIGINDKSKLSDLAQPLHSLSLTGPSCFCMFDEVAIDFLCTSCGLSGVLLPLLLDALFAAAR